MKATFEASNGAKFIFYTETTVEMVRTVAASGAESTMTLDEFIAALCPQPNATDIKERYANLAEGTIQLSMGPATAEEVVELLGKQRAIIAKRIRESL